MRKKGGKTKNHKSKKRRMKRERVQERESRHHTEAAMRQNNSLLPSLRIALHTQKKEKKNKRKKI